MTFITVASLLLRLLLTDDVEEVLEELDGFRIDMSQKIKEK